MTVAANQRTKSKVGDLMKIRTIILSMGILLFHPRADSQNTAVRWSSFNMGFETSIAPNTIIRSVVGQSFVGESSSSDMRSISGFLTDPVLRGIVLSVHDKQEIPLSFLLRQNYPNPFNPSTIIRYQLPVSSWVTMKVYNVLGQEIATLLNNELMDEGMQEYEFNASNLPSGVYFYRIVVQDITEDEEGNTVSGGKTFVSVKKMLLLK